MNFFVLNMNWRRYFGPSTMVTAAFIGPGTVTMCTLVGARTGSTLLWALVFSVLATIVLQEMSARLGVVTRMGMGEALREHLPSGVVRLAALVLVFSAIVVGNAAYEGGNLSGAVLGLQAWLGEGLASSGGGTGFGFCVSFELVITPFDGWNCLWSIV